MIKFAYTDIITFSYWGDFVPQEPIDEIIAHAMGQQEHPSIGQIECLFNEELQIAVILLHHF
jgi:hypothetical protein